MHQLRKANKKWGNYSQGSLKRVIPVLEMYETIEPVGPPPPEGCIPDGPANAPKVSGFVRHDACAAFANGADGVMIWSMGNRPGFLNYSNYYAAWAQFAQETVAHGIT